MLYHYYFDDALKETNKEECCKEINTILNDITRFKFGKLKDYQVSITKFTSRYTIDRSAEITKFTFTKDEHESYVNNTKRKFVICILFDRSNTLDYKATNEDKIIKEPFFLGYEYKPRHIFRINAYY